VGGMKTKDTRQAGKSKNSASSFSWRSVEYQNRILLEACGSTCCRSKI